MKKKKPIIILIAITLLMVVNIGHADIDNLRFLGRSEVNRHLMDAEVVGNRAYICVGFSGGGLEVYDIATPSNPRRIYQLGPPAWRCFTYRDTLLFLFCRRDGVVLYDISGSGQPVQLGQYNPPGPREALEGGALIGDTLYCAAHQNGIYAIDISNRSNPIKIGEISLDSSAAWNVETKDSFLLVANGRFGLSVVGVRGGMHLVAQLPLPGLANDIVMDGNIVAVALGAHGLATIDISNPRNPVLLDIAGTKGCVWGSGITGHEVVAGSWFALEHFDISTPENIMNTGWDNTKIWVHGADVRNDSVIAIADWRGMACYKIGSDLSPDIDVDPEILDFGSVSTSRETTIVARNTGTTILNVSSINAPSGIVPSPGSFAVQPGDSQVVRITASGAGSVSGTIVYNSNDPDEAGKIQEVYKNNAGFPQYGSVAPNFTLQGTDGRSHTLTNYRGKVVFLQFGGGW